MDSKKFIYIDNLKAIGIILVVIGHIFPRQNIDVIYLFHMPLFFMLSGFLYKPQDISSYVLKKAKRIILPYLLFLISIFIINALINITIYNSSLHDVFKGFSKMIYGGEKLKGDFGAFWFATTLFFTLIIFNWIIVNIKASYAVTLLAIFYISAYIVQFVSPEFRMPLGLNICLYTIPLIWIGWNLSKNILLFKATSILGLIFMIAYVFEPTMFGKVDLKTASYGVPFISTTIAVFFFYTLIEISKKIPTCKVITYIGRASLIIMFTHQWFHFQYEKIGISNPLTLSVMSLASSLLIHFIFGKYELSRKYLLGENIISR
ncbi:acyltransferase family protein [Enterobacter wuhouensis]|uniref:acyltransferase family protein n=1 Tax=Enterobacter wuhouensis TaxID=2529381 RepID=UPI00352592BE